MTTKVEIRTQETTLVTIEWADLARLINKGKVEGLAALPLSVGPLVDITAPEDGRARIEIELDGDWRRSCGLGKLKDKS